MAPEGVVEGCDYPSTYLLESRFSSSERPNNNFRVCATRVRLTVRPGTIPERHPVAADSASCLGIFGGMTPGVQWFMERVVVARNTVCAERKPSSLWPAMQPDHGRTPPTVRQRASPAVEWRQRLFLDGTLGHPSNASQNPEARCRVPGDTMSLEAWDAIDGQTGSVEGIKRLASSPLHDDAYLSDRNYASEPITY